VSLGRYCSIIVGVTALSLAGLRVALARFDPETWRAVSVGGALAAANAAAAYALVAWSTGRSNVVFFRAVLGGTLGRMAALLVGVLVAIVGFGVPRLPLVASLLAYFVAFLVFEVAVVHRRTGAQLEAAR
jgi:hypothetical protein